MKQSVRSGTARGLSSNRDLHKIPVYVVASLGGGTGSGIVLTLAKHLRRTLPTYCVLQGVFLLASISALAPGKADEASIWANTDAALREIDYFQRSQAFRLDQPTPYLEWPGAGNRIPNREEPFPVHLSLHRVQWEKPIPSIHWTRIRAWSLSAWSLRISAKSMN